VIISVDYDFEQGYIEPVARVMMARLRLEDKGGVVCVGPVHDNTVERLEALGRS
jgi:hypothetical protein